jgi:hypothetical protein
MSGVFQKKSPLGECVYTPMPLVRGEDTLAGERGWGVNILEDARHCSVLYIRKYFVLAVNMKILLAIVEAALRCDVNCPARPQ